MKAINGLLYKRNILNCKISNYKPSIFTKSQTLHKKMHLTKWKNKNY